MDPTTPSAPSGADPATGHSDGSTHGQPDHLDETAGPLDIVVIGGGAAGLAAALSAARSLRSVVVVDAGEPRNAPAHGVHAFLTRDGTSPHELLALGRDEVRRYGGVIREGRVVRGRRVDDGPLEVELQDGVTLAARRLIVTTGIRDVLPPVPGLRDHWGRDVVHCPFCHGWEVKGRRIGVLVTGATCLHQAAMFGHLADELVLLSHTSGMGREALDATGFPVVDGEVVAVTGEGSLSGVELVDGRVIELGALVVAPRFEVEGELLASLGLGTVDHPSGSGQHVPSSPDGQTDVPGIWVAGNVMDPMAQVMAAAAQGNLAGARVHNDLLIEDRS